LVAGEEIESKPPHVISSALTSHISLDPFGYDKNDLNMDYFTDVIIRKSLFSAGAQRNSFPLRQ